MQGVILEDHAHGAKPIAYDVFATFSTDGPSTFKPVLMNRLSREISQKHDETMEEQNSHASDEVHERPELAKPSTIILHSRNNKDVIHEKWIPETAFNSEEDKVMNNALNFTYKSFAAERTYLSHFDFRNPYLYTYCSQTGHLFEINTTTFGKEAITKGHEYKSGLELPGRLVLANYQTNKPHIVTFAETVAKPAMIQSKKKDTNSTSSSPDKGFTSFSLEGEPSSAALKIRSFPVTFEPHVYGCDDQLIPRHRVFSADANRVVYVAGTNSFAFFQVPNLQLKQCPVECQRLNDVCIKGSYIYWLSREGVIGRLSIYLDKKAARSTKMDLPDKSSALLIQSSDRFLFILTREQENRYYVHSFTNTNMKSLNMKKTGVHTEGDTGFLDFKTFQSDRSLATLLTVAFTSSLTVFNVCVSVKRQAVLTKLHHEKVEGAANKITHVDFVNYSIVICIGSTFKSLLVNF